MAPDGVTIHTTRMPLHADTTSEAGARALYQDIEQASDYLARARVDVIAYGCTAGSMVLPRTKVSDFMKAATGIKSVTTAAAIVSALEALGVTKIAVATPYHDALNHHEVEFLRQVGIEVTAISGLDIGAGGSHEYIQIAQTPRDEILQHVIETDTSEAEAMLISCTDFPVMTMIAELEQQLNKPVVTSNQATFWATLRSAGVADRFDKYGALLQNH